MRQLNDALVSQKHEAWVDWKDIPLTAEWQQEILTNIEAAESFVFVISSDSVTSPNCRKEIDHAVSNNKRIVPIFLRPVPDDAIPPALARFQRLDFVDNDGFDRKLLELITALDTDLAWVQMHTRLLTRAKEWEREGNESSFLLRGKDLYEAEQWIAKSAEREPKATPLHSRYLLASRQSSTRLQRIVTGAVIVAFMIAAGLAVYAFIQKNVAQRNARESKARELTAYAAMSLQDDPSVALFLGWQAAEISRPLAPGLERVLDDAFLTGSLGTFRGHQDKVISVAWSPDGESVVSMDDRGVVKVWDRHTGQELRTFDVLFDDIHEVAWSADRKFLAVKGRWDSDDAYESLEVWDVDTGKRLGTLDNHLLGESGMAWSPDGKTLAVLTRTAVRRWDLRTSQPLATLGLQGVIGMAWSPDGKTLAVWTRDEAKLWDSSTGQPLRALGCDQESQAGLQQGIVWSLDSKFLAGLCNVGAKKSVVQIWDAGTGKKLPTISDLRGDISSLEWSPDGEHIAFVVEGESIQLSHLATGRDQLLKPNGDKDTINSLDWSPDGKYIASVDSAHTVKLWDGATGHELSAFRHPDRVTSVEWSPDSKSIASGSEDGTVKLWDATDQGQEIGLLSGVHGTKDDDDAKVEVKWSPDSKFLASANAEEWTLAVARWDADTKQEIHHDLRAPQTPTSIASWSPDGRILASAELDKVTLWDTDAGIELRILQGHQDRVTSVAWSPDGKFLASGSDDETVKLWDTSTGKELRTFRGHQDRVESIMWSPDGKSLASGHRDYTLRLWNVATGTELRTFRERLYNATWSPDGKYLASSEAVWDARSGNKLRTLRGNPNWATVTWSPDGKFLASVENAVTLWDAGTGRLLRTFGCDTGCRTIVTWSPDSRYLACGTGAGVKLWDASTGEEFRTIGGHDHLVTSMAWSPDGRSLAFGSNDNTVTIWDTRTWKGLDTLRDLPGDVLSMTWSPDGKSLASANAVRKELTLTASRWDAGTRRELRRTLRGPQAQTRLLSWSPDGRLLASVEGDKVTLWDAGIGKSLHTFGSLGDKIGSVDWSPNGKLLSFVGDDKVTLWDAVTGSNLRTLSGRVDKVAWNPNGRSLASENHGMVKIWDTRTGKELRTILDHWVEGWSPDGRYLALGTKDTIEIWDTATGKESLALQGHHDGATTVEWSPDGKHLAFETEDNAVEIWDTATGKEFLALQGHRKRVTSVAWSPDGKSLASGSRDETVKLWDTGTGKELRTFRGHQGSVQSVTWSPDGRFIASENEDGTVRIYPVATDLLLSIVRDRVRKVMVNPDVCQRFFSSATCPTVK